MESVILLFNYIFMCNKCKYRVTYFDNKSKQIKWEVVDNYNKAVIMQGKTLGNISVIN